MRTVRSGRLYLAGVTAVIAVLTLGTVATASSANISHSYRTAKPVRDGSIVSLDPDRSDYVVPANLDNGARLLGVAVAPDDSLIAVDASTGTTQVATSGSATVLVSTLNGDIKVGDQIAVSPFDGVGMKALPGSRIVGLAQIGFNAQSPGATPEQITDKAGKRSRVYVGYVQVTMAVGTNANSLAGDLNSLQRFAESLTGRVIATERIAISLAVALIAVLALITLVYASIHGSIISVGRNPLAKYAVFRTLTVVLGLALLITVIAGLIIFLLLR